MYSIKNTIDYIKYGVTRSSLKKLHVLFSKYMIKKIKYLRDNIKEDDYRPYRYDNSGNMVGTLEYKEWMTILDEMIYSLEIDINQMGDKNNIIKQEDINNYISNEENINKRYKQGLRLLGIYYSDIWV